MASMQKNLAQIADVARAAFLRYSNAEVQIKQEVHALRKARQRLKHVIKAQAILQQIAKAVQEEAHDKIAGVVTRCLAAVFDDPYQFKIIFEKKRGKTEARMVFIKDGHIVKPNTASGGGSIDVAAFAIRLACLMLQRPHKRRLMVLDEPFKHVDVDNRERVKEMLLELAKDLKLQIIMVTHSDQLVCGKIVQL